MLLESSRTRYQARRTPANGCVQRAADISLRDSWEQKLHGVRHFNAEQIKRSRQIAVREFNNPEQEVFTRAVLLRQDVEAMIEIVERLSQLKGILSDSRRFCRHNHLLRHSF